MFTELDNYDWANVFGYAGEKSIGDKYENDNYEKWIYGHGTPRLTIGADCNIDPFTREDVEDIIAMSNGFNDGDDWLGVFYLKDGRFAFIKAGCDYTGWDCRAGGDTYVSDTRENLIQFGMDDVSRIRLKL